MRSFLLLAASAHSRVALMRRGLTGSAARASVGMGDEPRAAESRIAEPRAESSDAKHLIRNHGNKVHIERCSSLAELDAAAEMYGHLPQVCFAGESNAGKSSMLNHLVGQRVSRSSSVAGKTRTIDFIVVNDRVVLTDLPGLPARDGQTTMLWDTVFEPLFRAYLDSPIDLRAMFFLHDCRWRVSTPIAAFVEEMRRIELPTVLVLTKDDQIEEPAMRNVHLRKVTKRLDWTGMHVHYAATNETPNGRKSRRQVLRYIETFAEAGSREACAEKLEELIRERSARRASPAVPGSASGAEAA